MQKEGLKIINKCRLTKVEVWLNSYLVKYPVSYRYNGLVEVEGKLYTGFSVPKPVIPKGYTLVDIGIGLQLNMRPPMATKYLKPIEYNRTYVINHLSHK